MAREINKMNIIKDTSYIIINNHSNYKTNINKDIVLFDLDDTLIKFNLKSSDYSLMYLNTIEKLKELSTDNNILIISNQKQLNKKEMYDVFMKKIEKLFTNINISIEIYISIKNDKYRKPNTGLYYKFRQKYIGHIKYYCGDALGRKGDFSDTDLKFALNLNIPIRSPEEVFINNAIETRYIRYPRLNKKQCKFEYVSKRKEMIIMVGYPGSGKSTIANTIFEEAFCKDIPYKIINRDTLKTIQKCIKETITALKYNMSVIIDNTNPSKESRKIFIDIAKKYNYKVKAIIINTSYLESLHRNYYRHIKYNKPLIPEIAYRIFKSKYEPPILKEGIDSIITSEINIYDIDYFKYYF